MERSSDRLKRLNLALGNLKSVKLLEIEIEAFLKSNCNKRFVGFSNMHVLFNMLPSGTPLEIIPNF